MSVPRIHIHNLGCDKNRVDGEKLAAKLRAKGYDLLPSPDRADLIIVNTCGFIDAAKKESIGAVFEFLKGKKVAVAGCLAERYGAELKKECPEAEMILGLSDSPETLYAILKRHPISRPAHEKRPATRILSGPGHTAPLKIAEGCGNRCSYCAIPLIRGAFRARAEKEILTEARELRRQGVQEAVLVAQDITAYGDRAGLPGLLRKLCDLTDPFPWIRLMYCHPSGVTDDLISAMADLAPVVKYIDMPIQHASDPMLAAMNRRYTRRQVETILDKLRKRIPGIAVRTTFLTGFPGETEARYRELLDFVRATEPDRMGVFCYSPEEGTPALPMKGRVPARTAEARREELMFLANDIIYRKNREKIGKQVEILVDEISDGLRLARTPQDAPEVDCNVILRQGSQKPGDLCRVLITDAAGLDLYA